MALHGSGPGGVPATTGYWHGHELIVGFAMATVGGFILTAVATWTNRPPVRGRPLAWLMWAWIVGRIAMMAATRLSPWLVAALDMLFPTLLVWFVGREVVGGGSRRNYPIIGITALLAVLNGIYHAGILMHRPDGQRLALYLIIYLILVLITVIAGRIIPNFTANWLRARGSERLPTTHVLLDRLTIIATLAAGIAAAITPFGRFTAGAAAVAALLHTVRLARWRGLATIGEPLLFVLHVAYLWLPIGYALTACAAVGVLLPATAALHALTMGAIGTMILAVTTRVALAHTGRPLHATRLIVLSYWIFSVAVVVRVLSPLSASRYMDLLDISALGWITTFIIFAWVYWPILTRPSVD
jgi:uncharacterized protein involved in response to NO